LLDRLQNETQRERETQQTSQHMEGWNLEQYAKKKKSVSIVGRRKNMSVG
jgi:hypothetical protein